MIDLSNEPLDNTNKTNAVIALNIARKTDSVGVENFGCTACTFINEPDCDACTACGNALTFFAGSSSSRLGKRPLSPPAVQSSSIRDDKCTAGREEAGKAPGKHNETAANCPCSVCTFINPPATTHCLMCSNKLAPTAPVACPRCSYIFGVGERLVVCTVCNYKFVGPSGGKKRAECRICNTWGHWAVDCPLVTSEADAAEPAVGDAVAGFNSLQTTDGLVELLDTEFRQSRSTNTYRLCSPCQHITQRRTEGTDWACGYRNIQMLILSLNQIAAYRTRMFNGDGEIPDVHGLQSWIERAWAAGFDSAAAADFRGGLLGSDDFIGATECCALLRFFGLRAHLVTFADWLSSSATTGPSGTGKPARTSVTAASPNSLRLASWLKRYFSTSKGLPQGKVSSGLAGYGFDNKAFAPAHGGSGQAGNGANGTTDLSNAIPDDFLPPLYFQHDGHSRTIVGYEMNSSGKMSLLLFDPNSVGQDIKRKLINHQGYWQQSIKRQLSTMTQTSYQLVFVSGIMWNAEKERAKVIRETREEMPLDVELE